MVKFIFVKRPMGIIFLAHRSFLLNKVYLYLKVEISGRKKDGFAPWFTKRQFTGSNFSTF
jgi:hypothetical protein